VELRRTSIESAFDDLKARGTDMIVVSGGEPLLQQDALEPLLRRARLTGWWIEVETAGTIAPSTVFTAEVSRFNVSPKLANSGNSLEKRYRPDALVSLQASGKSIWKFVVREPRELDEVQELVDLFKLSPVYIMPEGISAQDVAARLQVLAQPVLDRGWNLTSRLHVLLYGNKRGV
jgi:organic radical activating enzyme